MNRKTARVATILAVMGLAIMLLATVAYGQNHQIRICHATGSASNPYTDPIPTKPQIFDPDGHGSLDAGVHPDDIVPPFAAGQLGNNTWDDYPGKNWTVEGQAIWNNRCKTPNPTTTTAPPATTSTTQPQNPTTTTTSTVPPPPTTTTTIQAPTTSTTTATSTSITTSTVVTNTTIPTDTTSTTEVTPTPTSITTPTPTITELPRTGPADFWPLFGAGVVALVAGAALLTLGRLIRPGESDV